MRQGCRFPRCQDPARARSDEGSRRSLHAPHEKIHAGNGYYTMQRLDENAIRAGISQFPPLYGAPRAIDLAVDAHGRYLLYGRDALAAALRSRRRSATARAGRGPSQRKGKAIPSDIAKPGCRRSGHSDQGGPIDQCTRARKRVRIPWRRKAMAAARRPGYHFDRALAQCGACPVPAAGKAERDGLWRLITERSPDDKRKAGVGPSGNERFIRQIRTLRHQCGPCARRGFYHGVPREDLRHGKLPFRRARQ